MTTNTPATAQAGGALAALSNLKQGLANVKQAVRSPGGDPLMKLGKNDGVWYYGADNVEVEADSEWALNPLSIRFGYICWKKIPEGSKAKPEMFGKHTRLMHQPPLDPMTLQAKDSEDRDVDHSKHPWEEWLGIDMLCVSGEDAGTQCPYEPSSSGGVFAMRDLIDKVNAQVTADAAHPVPVVILKSKQRPSNWGPYYVPIFEIVRWVGFEDAGAGSEAPSEPDTSKTEASPTRRGKAAPAPEPEQEQQQQEEQSEEAAPSTGSEAAPAGERRRRRR